MRIRLLVPLVMLACTSAPQAVFSSDRAPARFPSPTLGADAPAPAERSPTAYPSGVDTPPSDDPAVAQRFLGECDTEWLPSSARCGRLSVPLDHDGRVDGAVELAVVVLPAPGPDPAPDPLFLLTGGPGQAATSMSRWMARGRRGALARRDLVFVDQRGTGGSTSLACETDPGVGHAFGRLHPPSEALERCLERVRATTDPEWYTTYQAARDLDAVRQALGYDRINLRGWSYGTRLALDYLRRYENHVRTAVLTGVMPADYQAPLWYAHHAQSGLDHVFDSCAGRPACAGAFPDVRGEWAALLAGLRAEPARVEVRASEDAAAELVTFTANDLAYTVRSALYGSEALDLPSLIHQAWTTGDVSAFAQRYARRAAGLRPQISRGVHLSVLCSEDVSRIAEYEIGAAVGGTYLGDYAVREYQRACRNWTAGPVPPNFHDPVTSDRPVLLLSGARDPTTPPSAGAEVARYLPNSLHIVHPWGGHGFTGTEDPECEDGIVDAFLETGSSQGVDTSCLERARPLPFRLTPEEEAGGIERDAAWG